jgi:hypothetical protein
MQEDAGDVAALPFDPVTRTVECRRGADGILRCNIPQRHKHHSPTGFECGFAGSGPADLALNILALFIPAPPDPRPRLDQEQPRAQDWEDWDEAEDPEYDRVKLHDGS